MKRWHKVLLALMLVATTAWAVDKTYNDITNEATEADIAADWLLRMDDPTVLSYKITAPNFLDWIEANIATITSALTITGDPTITGSGSASLKIDGAGQAIELGDNATDPVEITDAGLLKVSDDRIYNRYWFGRTLESPADADKWMFWQPEMAITITDISCIVDPTDSSESAVLDLQECNSTGDSCVTVDAAITCDNDGAADDGSLSNGAIDANDWLLLDVGTVTGTVTDATITVWYTVN